MAFPLLPGTICLVRIPQISPKKTHTVCARAFSNRKTAERCRQKHDCTATGMWGLPIRHKIRGLGFTMSDDFPGSFSLRDLSTRMAWSEVCTPKECPPKDPAEGITCKGLPVSGSAMDPERERLPAKSASEPQDPGGEKRFLIGGRIVPTGYSSKKTSPKASGEVFEDIQTCSLFGEYMSDIIFWLVPCRGRGALRHPEAAEPDGCRGRDVRGDAVQDRGVCPDRDALRHPEAAEPDGCPGRGVRDDAVRDRGVCLGRGAPHHPEAAEPDGCPDRDARDGAVRDRDDGRGRGPDHLHGLWAVEPDGCRGLL